jgi:hypothetical protein
MRIGHSDSFDAEGIGRRPSACEVRCTNWLAAYFLRILRATLQFAKAKQVRLS